MKKHHSLYLTCVVACHMLLLQVYWILFDLNGITITTNYTIESEIAFCVVTFLAFTFINFVAMLIPMGRDLLNKEENSYKSMFYKVELVTLGVVIVIDNLLLY